MSTDHPDVKAIFCGALDIPPGLERTAYLERVCQDRLDIRSQVEELLRLHDGAGHFLESPFIDCEVSLDATGIVEGPGTVIGRYKLLERIGEGGMAVVYMAEQEQPISRKVALKIIKLGMDTRQVIARFEAERQALAMMDHPNIAKVLDAGATETGRPYFVMELVQGVSITEHCDGNNLSTKDRLGLFIQVCQAIQHAHTKGIIHRDIKPSNVLVAHRDGKPVPKVIDFGIAKATSQKLTEKTLFTRYAHIIGTPAYMSPEQAELSDVDIDTRTDIYSLGVLLYELLTGTTPFSEEELRKAGYVEMQRVIREQQPVKPSTRIRTAYVAQPPSAGVTPEGGGATGVHSTPYQQVRGDLDWIVMKSLEKDRSRRYETAHSLAEEIRRHLEHEPVLAHGPGTLYRLRKLLRRHCTAAVAIVMFAILIGVVTTVVVLWIRDRHQLLEAQGFREQTILSQAQEQYARADYETAMETISLILDSEHVGPAARLLQATILVDNRRPDEAIAVLNGLLDESPKIAGAAHSLYVRILLESESLDAQKIQEMEDHRRKAETLLEETAEAHFLRAMTAVTIKEQLVALDKALQLDPRHYESRRLRAFTYYASRKYERMKDDAMAMTTLRPRDPVGHSLHAIAWRELGHYPEAIADYDLAISLPQGDAQRTDLFMQRCETRLRMEDYEQVVADARECFRLWPDAPVFQYYTFCALTALGEYETATTLFRKIIAPGHATRLRFMEWCMKYVFDTLEAGRLWHPTDREPVGAAFLAMVEAEEAYRSLSAKGYRLATGGFSACWSPDGKKLAFSLGVRGYSGVAVFDPATRETDLLIVPGKDPRWPPDGRHIAFVRDHQNLRLEELVTPEPGKLRPPVTDEELWIMNADGTEPRRLARGSWPSWNSDSQHVCYVSPGDNALCSISLVEQDTRPKRIMKSTNVPPSISPDDQRVAYFEGGSLKIKDLSSQETIAECGMSSMAWGVTGWSPNGHEVCLGGGNPERDNTGLWLYNLQTKEFRCVLDGKIAATCWAPGATELTLCLGTPYLEVWSIPLAPGVTTSKALGGGHTPDEHLRKMIAFYSRRIEADPNDPYPYYSRAQYSDRLGERDKATEDMRKWSAILGGRQSPDPSSLTPRTSRRVIRISPSCEFVFSAERRVNAMSMMSVAFGQKGRCEVKLFEMPMFVASLFGFCVASCLDSPVTRADFTLGPRVDLDTTVGSPQGDGIPVLSRDGLELYFASTRSGGSGGWDIWMTQRATVEDPWEAPVNLGSGVNNAENEYPTSISSNGLTLYFFVGTYTFRLYTATRATRDASWGSRVDLGPVINSGTVDLGAMISPDDLELFLVSSRSGGLGGLDIYVSTRVTPTSPWEPPVNLGPVVNTPGNEATGPMSPDGLVMFMNAENRPGGCGGWDTWMIRRSSKDAPWSEPVNLGTSFNTSDGECLFSLSPDGQCAYGQEYVGAPVGSLWTVPITVCADFNADAEVDLVDLVMLINDWGMSDTLYDIGPMPWGDGVVDIEDLKAFIAEWEKETAVTEP